MAALTQTDIANMALALLTEGSIESLDEDVKSARMLNLHFETTREAEMMKHVWRFSILSANVDAAETGDTDFPYSYELPADALRALPVEYYGDELDWRAAGTTIETRYGGNRTIRYVGNLIDPNDWDALFTDLFAAALAMKIAHPITGKASMIEIAQNAYDRAKREALRVNAILKQGRASAGTWDQARRGIVYDRHGARARHGGGL